MRRHDARHPASREHGGQHPREPVHPACVRRSRIATVLTVAIAVGLLSAFLPFAAAAGTTAAILGGWTWFAVSAFKSGSWLNLVQPLAAGGIALFAGTAYRYFVEGSREAQGEAAVRALRVARRVRAAHRAPGTGGAWRQAPRDVGALLRHPGLHDRHREGQPGGARRAAERVFLTDGGRRVPPQGDGGQVRRRHGHGPVRCAARRR